jgi:hypothetical protein
VNFHSFHFDSIGGVIIMIEYVNVNFDSVVVDSSSAGP